ncbi:MAG TPA: hypothetical protein VKB58_17625 [Terriglobales bacterium]|nr:hypothetical protein [Terriglobales bacterium]
MTPFDRNDEAGAERLSAGQLRRELSARNLRLAEGVPHEATFSAIPSILYQDANGGHGNFLPAAYRRICSHPEWRRRLAKCYTASKRIPRPQDRIRRELDCANSSDALLMNIFCYPGITRRSAVCSLLGIRPRLRPQFGVKPGLSLVTGHTDRTEIDMGLGHLFVEAKLTESGFPHGRADLVLRYKDFPIVFDPGELPSRHRIYESYQLIRGVLAAHHCERYFLLLCDARRDDLTEAFYRVVRAVRNCELRSRLAILSWQELSGTLPKSLRQFLQNKYGIRSR